MAQTYKFKNREQTFIPDDAIVVSNDDAPVFITRLTRITKTIEHLVIQDVATGPVGIIAGDLRFVCTYPNEVCMYHINGERVGSFAWLPVDLEYFVGVTMELGNEYFEGKFIVDIESPLVLYTRSLQIVEKYEFEDLFGEFMEFIEDYGIKLINHDSDEVV